MFLKVQIQCACDKSQCQSTIEIDDGYQLRSYFSNYIGKNVLCFSRKNIIICLNMIDVSVEYIIGHLFNFCFQSKKCITLGFRDTIEEIKTKEEINLNICCCRHISRLKDDIELKSYFFKVYKQNNTNDILINKYNKKEFENMINNAHYLFENEMKSNCFIDLSLYDQVQHLKKSSGEILHSSRDINFLKSEIKSQKEELAELNSKFEKYKKSIKSMTIKIIEDVFVNISSTKNRKRNRDSDNCDEYYKREAKKKKFE